MHNTDPSTDTIFHTPANEAGQPITSDELRRCDQRFAGELAKNANELEVLAWASLRGILPSTLQEWGAALVPAQAFEHMGKTLDAGDYLRAGLIVRRHRAPLEKKVEQDHKHALASDDKDRRADLSGFRHWLGGRVAWPLRDTTGVIRTFVGRWFDDQRTMSEVAGDFAADEIWFGEAASTKPAKYLSLKKNRCSRLAVGEAESEHFPLQLSPGFIARASGIDFSEEEEEKPRGKKSKYDKLKDKTTPVWITEGYVDGILAAQAGASTIALGGCETHAEQVALLVRLLTPFAEFNVQVYLCLDSDPPNAHARGKHIALGAGQRGVCDLVGAIRARHPDLARLIRVIDLSSHGGSKVDLADVLQKIHGSIPAPSSGSPDDILAMDTWADQVRAAQAAKLRELEAAAVDADEFQLAQIPQGVARKDWTAALEETGVAGLAAHDPDLFAHRLDQICDRLELAKSDRKGWAKRFEKEATEEAEREEKHNEEDKLASYRRKDGSIMPEHEAIRTLVEQMSESWDPRDRLWWDEMHLVPVMWGEEFSDSALAELRRKLARQHRCDVRHKSDLREVVDNISQLDRRHPVREYLKGLKWDEVDRIPVVLEQVLGITSESEDQRTLYTAFLRKWMIGAVARVHATSKATEKFDNVLVLGGMQDLRKSSFFQYLVPDKRWAASPDISEFNDNSAVKLCPVWIAEMAESNGTSYWKDLERQKAFLSKESDLVIRKYQAYAEIIPRRFALGASVNEKQHGTDSTGFRRQWCMWLTKVVDTDLLATIRDQLWAQAYAAYKSGEKWHLNEHEKALHLVDGQRFQVGDLEQDQVRAWLSSNGKREVLGTEVAAGIGIDHPHSGDTRRIVKHLAALGWEPRGVKRPCPYVAPEDWHPSGLSVLPGGASAPTPAELVAGILDPG